MTLRHALVALVTPLVWRVPGHGGRKLYGFARAEQASRIDLLLAAQRTPSLARRAAYLRHALDETRHAAMFWRRSTKLRLDEQRAPFTPPVADTEDLFERLGERRFLAFVHRGEQRGRAQFELYARHFGKHGDGRTEALFKAIAAAHRERLASVRHVDGSARVQTADAATAPELAAVLGALDRTIGMPIALNTSFNGAGEPIIANEIDALGFLMSHPIDALVVGELVITRGAA